MKKFIKICVICIVLTNHSAMLSAYPESEINSKKILLGTASWYSESDPGILLTTANMEIFDDTELTCAMWNIPFNTLVKVTNLDNGKSIVVRVNDRGPAKRLVKSGRIIDLTKGAFSKIANLNTGLIPIEVEILKSRKISFI